MMKKRISFISIPIFTIFASVNVAANEYIPWQKGDYAVFQSDKFNITKTAKVDLHIGNWKHFTEFSGLGKMWMYTAQYSERVYLYTPDDFSLHYLVDFDSPVGSKTHIDIPPCNNGDVIVGAKNQQLTIPAGNFNNVIRLDLETSCADAGVTNMWFAKGVGPIQWSESNITGRVNYQMVSGNIDGEVYPKPGGLVLKGQFPDPTLWINRMPPIPEPPLIVKTSVGLTIKNHSPETVTYNFPTSQQFDIYVINEKGQIVSKWSRGQVFLMVTTSIEIKPGDSFRIGGEVELAYENGQPLQPGNYKLKIFLSSYDSLDSTTGLISISSPASEMPVQIKWAY